MQWSDVSVKSQQHGGATLQLKGKQSKLSKLSYYKFDVETLMLHVLFFTAPHSQIKIILIYRILQPSS